MEETVHQKLNTFVASTCLWERVADTCVRVKLYCGERESARERLSYFIGRHGVVLPPLHAILYQKSIPPKNPSSHPVLLHRLGSGKHLTN